MTNTFTITKAQAFMVIVGLLTLLFDAGAAVVAFATAVALGYHDEDDEPDDEETTDE